LLRRILLLALLPASLFAKSYGEFDIAAPPQWIDRAPGEYQVAIPAGMSRYGVYDILSDHQVRVGQDGSTTQYFRTVRKVLTQSGVQNASELSIDFDPSFQRLVLHEITIVRGTVTTKELDAASVRVIEKEDDSDSAIYDGRLTALIFLKDVRAGDIIDWSWSIAGANPILNGHYADEYDLRTDLPAHRLRHRLLWNSTRPLQTHGQAPVVSGPTYTWEAHDVAAVNLEDALPSWYEPWESIEVSDFAAWSDVAKWSAEMFAVDDDSVDAVKAIADKIRHDHGADTVTAAIRFVQDDIRYLGLEIGRNSHEPRQPKEILEQRWGDCKEKALLLSLILRNLGLEADPALVNTKAKQRLDTFLPSPFAFDHVIVRVIAKGKTYWIDPTIAEQGGTLETIETPNDARALVVNEASTALTQIETIHRGRTVIDETYAAQNAASPTTLSVRTTYTGTDADAMRADLSSMAADEIARERLNRYAADHPSIVSTAPPHIDDDRVKNAITIAEHYSIRDLWKRGDWTYYPRALEPSLDKPKTVIRAMPLAFDYPLDIVQRATFRFPAGAEIDGTEAYARKTSAFLFRYRPTVRDRSVTIEYSLRALRDAVPITDVSRHLTAINDIEDEMGCTVRPMYGSVQMRVISGPVQSAPKWLWILGLTVALAGLSLLRFWKFSTTS
jgi:transglutaminase-like putative cysteine protease